MKSGRVLLALIAAVGSAWAQQENTCEPGEAPDVIVGDIFEVANHGGAAAISAFSVSTFSCNVGNCWMRWLQHTPYHPVIGQNLFRLRDGRFEQIGQSWIKHGVFALSTSLCSAGCIETDGRHLGVNCADPYTAFHNGWQQGLGPKSDVDAATGTIACCPFQAQGLVGNAIYKRLQVHDADLQAALNPGAKYYVEAQYVAPFAEPWQSGEAPETNTLNNASYHEVLVGDTFGSYTIELTGGIRREQAALHAWQAADPQVELATALADGWFLVAARATDLGGGAWHYEYAVQNLNSHRAAASFGVPFPLGATVSNVGFHDVDYHSEDATLRDGSGSRYDPTDWSSTSGTGYAVTWSTTPFAIDEDANALRWGTLYNFRFDADVPPATGRVTIGMFRPGAPAALDVQTIVPRLCASALPDSDADGWGDACDPCLGDPLNDSDGDGRCASVDNCPALANPEQVDADGDGVGSSCDNCAAVVNPEQADADADARGDACDACPLDAANDVDGDAACGDTDNCPGTANPGQANADGDALGDACDGCPLDAGNDADGDSVCGNVDNCPGAANAFQQNADGDGLGDACDLCPLDVANDGDADGICGNVDNCPQAANVGQADADVAFTIRQWGVTASASSEFTPESYSAQQATGAPDSPPTCVDAPTMWSPAEGGTAPEWLEVGYASAVRATGIRLRESSCVCAEGGPLPAGGFVQRIELRDQGGALHGVWMDSDGTACGLEFSPSWAPPSYLAAGVRIHTQIADYEEIDAVELTGHVGVASAAPDGIGDACDNCPGIHNPAQERLAFFEPILAVDADTLSWSSAFDVEYVGGDLVAVGAYAHTVGGQLPQATSIDIAADDPPAGGGRYYLVKLTGACGSWQSATGAEPARDAALP